MLELEVQPERSLGNEQWEFTLGMPFYQAVHILKRQDRTIKGVQIWYSDQNPLLTDLVINLSQDGIRLIFDSGQQRLKIIEVYNMTKVKLKYCGVPFNSQTVQPTIEQIDHSFGATHPGVYHAEKQLFVLNFRGLSFEFHIESKFEFDSRVVDGGLIAVPAEADLDPRYVSGLGSLQFPNGASPTVSRMHIYSGNSLEDTRPPPLPMQCFHGNCYLDCCEVLRENNVTKGLKFTIITEGPPAKLSDLQRVTTERVVYFGSTAQDVATLLGCPARVFYKSDDKMRIHASDQHRRRRDSRCCDYFLNYVTLGVDFLMDGETHRVKKFILHTNFPGHYDFNMYYRCEFGLPIWPERPPTPQLPSDTRLIPSADCLSIHYDTKWDGILDYLRVKDIKPVVLNRASSTNTTNPFGSTFCFGVQDMIFEVMQNSHIAAITLYQPKHRPPPNTTTSLS